MAAAAKTATEQAMLNLLANRYAAMATAFRDGALRDDLTQEIARG